MAKNNVNSNAEIIKSNVATNSYQLGQFLGNEESNQIQQGASLNDREINGNIDPVLIEIKSLAEQLNQIQTKVIDIENDGIKGRDLDKQLVQALKDLKNYA